jgi:four helix bundle protein
MEALARLEVWKRACRFAVDVYKATSRCRDRGFRDQVTRSALSVPSNVAEGYERESVRERVRFLLIAKGSCGECWTQLLIGIEAGFLDPANGQALAKEVLELSKMLRGLVKHFESRIGEPPQP